MGILEAVSGKTRVKKVAVTKGGEYAGPCPLCGGSDRFRVWPADKGGEGSYWCRGCEKGGDLVQWYVDFEGMAYPEAFRAAGRAPLTPDANYTPKRYQPSHTAPTMAERDVFAPRRHETPVETWQIKARELIDASHARLLDSPRVLGWLSARGLDMAAVKAFSLGWFPGERDNPCMWRPRLSWGLPEVLKDNGQPKKLWIPRGVVIPWIVDGQIMRIKIRRPKSDLGDKGVRYCFLPGSSSEPALLNADRKAYVVVESELDAMLIAAKAGGQVGSLALGSAGNKPGAYSWDRLQNALKVLVALDNDEAGNKAFAWWEDHLNNARRLTVPAGKDPGEAFALGVDIREWVMKGLPPVMTLNLHHFSLSKDPEARQKQDESNTEAKTPDEVPAMVSDPLPADLPMKTESPIPSDSGNAANDECWLPESILALREILMRYPVKIVCTAGRLGIVQAPDFRNDSVISKLSDLVFWDQDVESFIDIFPGNEIHRGNFAQGL